MSGKTAKRERKELKEREKAFLAGLDKLSEEHRIGLQPVLQFTPTGVVPAMRLIDEIGKYESLTNEAKAQNEAERAANSGGGDAGAEEPAQDPSPTIDP